MTNSIEKSTASQQQARINAYQLRFLIVPWKIYTSPLRPSYQLILSRLYHFAKTSKNNIYASLQNIAENYGVSYGIMRNVVYEARQAGFIAPDSLKFIDIGSFDMPDNPEGKEVFPPYLVIPEHALFHDDLTCADQLTYALLYYRVNSDDGSVRNPKKELAETMGITVDALKWRIKKFEKADLVEKRSTSKNHRLYLTHYPTFVQQKLSYSKEKLSTDTSTLGGVDGDTGGVDGDTKGVWAVTHINNNIRNNNKIPATPLKEPSFEQSKEKHNLERGRFSGGGTTCTVLEYGSPEYKKREMERNGLAELSRKRGEEQMKAYMERKKVDTGNEARPVIKPPTGALNGLESVKQLLNIKG